MLLANGFDINADRNITNIPSFNLRLAKYKNHQYFLFKIFKIGLIVIGILIIVAITNPFLIMPTLIIVVIFFKIRNIYMTISQSIKRLEGVSKQK